MRRSARLRTKFSGALANGYVEVSASGDDGYSHNSGGFNNTDQSVVFGRDSGGNRYDVFLVFRNVVIPSGATITSAFVRFVRGSTVGSLASHQYDVYASDEAASITAPASGTYPWGKTQTTAKVDWDSWTDAASFDTPDISAVIQELVDTYAGTYAAGGDVCLLFEHMSSQSGGENRISGIAVEHATLAPARLYVTWT